MFLRRRKNVNVLVGTEVRKPFPRNVFRAMTLSLICQIWGGSGPAQTRWKMLGTTVVTVGQNRNQCAKKTLTPSVSIITIELTPSKAPLVPQVFRLRGTHRTSSQVAGVPPSLNFQPPTHLFSHRALRR